MAARGLAATLRLDDRADLCCGTGARMAAVDLTSVRARAPPACTRCLRRDRMASVDRRLTLRLELIRRERPRSTRKVAGAAACSDGVLTEAWRRLEAIFMRSKVTRAHGVRSLPHSTGAAAQCERATARGDRTWLGARPARRYAHRGRTRHWRDMDRRGDDRGVDDAGGCSLAHASVSLLGAGNGGPALGAAMRGPPVAASMR